MLTIVASSVAALALVLGILMFAPLVVLTIEVLVALGAAGGYSRTA